MKTIDDGTDKNPRTGFKRGMVAATIAKRFNIRLVAGFWNLGERPLESLTDLPACPECGEYTYLASVKVGEGIDVYFPQCVGHSDPRQHTDHGFGKFSKHGTRAPQGRKFGSKQKTQEPSGSGTTPTQPEPAPAPPHSTSAVTLGPEDPLNGLAASLIEKQWGAGATIAVLPEEKKTPEPEPAKGGKVIHPEIARATRYVLGGERNIYLTGPAGTGKSTGAEDLFEAIKKDGKWANGVIFKITVSMSTFVADLAGFLDRLNGGAYIESDLVKALRVPGVVVVDEADKGNPNLAGFWNTILANNEITTPGGLFPRHPDNVVIFIGNTTGHAPNKQYSGSVRQDFATLDRFRCFNVGFNEAVERSAIPRLNHKLYDTIKSVRTLAESSGLQRIVGLRWARRCQTTMEIEGCGAIEAVKRIMKDESWSNDEILAAGMK